MHASKRAQHGRWLHVVLRASLTSDRLLVTLVFAPLYMLPLHFGIWFGSS
jgi:hypothetical protein